MPWICRHALSTERHIPKVGNSRTEIKSDVLQMKRSVAAGSEAGIIIQETVKTGPLARHLHSFRTERVVSSHFRKLFQKTRSHRLISLNPTVAFFLFVTCLSSSMQNSSPGRSLCIRLPTFSDADKWEKYSSLLLQEI